MYIWLHEILSPQLSLIPFPWFLLPYSSIISSYFWLQFIIPEVSILMKIVGFWYTLSYKTTGSCLFCHLVKKKKTKNKQKTTTTKNPSATRRMKLMEMEMRASGLKSLNPKSLNSRPMLVYSTRDPNILQKMSSFVLVHLSLVYVIAIHRTLINTGYVS